MKNSYFYGVAFSLSFFCVSKVAVNDTCFVKQYHGKRLHLIQDNKIKYLEFEEVFRLGDNTSNNQSFFHVYNPKLDNDRNLYVDDHGNNRVQVFNKKGEFIHSISNPGQGPGEYQQLGEVLLDNNGNIVLHDRLAMKLIKMERNRDHIADYRYHDKVKSMINYPQYFNTGELLFCLKDRKDPENIICRFYKMDPQLQDTTFLFSIVEEWRVLQKGRRTSAPKYYLHVSVSPENEIFIVNSDRYIIDVMSYGGEKIRTITKKYERLERPAEERKHPLVGNMKTCKYLYPMKYYDDIRNIYFPLPQQVWVLPSRKLNGYSVFDVFNDKGKFMHQVVLKIPAGKEFSFCYEKEKKTLYLYQVELTDDNEEIIVCYRTNMN